MTVIILCYPQKPLQPCTLNNTRPTLKNTGKKLLQSPIRLFKHLRILQNICVNHFCTPNRVIRKLQQILNHLLP